MLGIILILSRIQEVGDRLQLHKDITRILDRTSAKVVSKSMRDAKCSRLK